MLPVGRMRVLYFHQYFSTPEGAAGTRSYEMARRLVARGHQVLMVCGSAARGHTGLTAPFVGGSRRGMVDGIEVLEFELRYSNYHGLFRRGLIFLRFALRSIGVALREPCDLIFATTTPLTAGIPGVLARWLRRKPFVFEVRDLWPELPRAMGLIRNPVVLWALSCLEWVSYRSATWCVGLAPGIVEGIVRRGVPRERVAMIPNGCDLALFGQEPRAWRPDGVAPDDLLAVFTGAHGPANGLEAVVDAAAALEQRGVRGITLLLVGDGKCKPALVEQARERGLRNLHFHDPVTKRELAGLTHAADLGLQILADVPAFYEGTSPNKFFDYLSAGLPVLINYPGWLAALVRQHRCGYAVPPRDPVAFADALEHAAAHRVLLKEMGARARALAGEAFDRTRLADALADLLEQVVRGGPAR